jgi:hypothetical protein
MVLIGSVLALTLTGFAVVQSPFLRGLLPDFTPLSSELTPRKQPVVYLSQGIVLGEPTCPSNLPIERFLGQIACIPPCFVVSNCR